MSCHTTLKLKNLGMNSKVIAVGNKSLVETGTDFQEFSFSVIAERPLTPATPEKGFVGKGWGPHLKVLGGTSLSTHNAQRTMQHWGLDPGFLPAKHTLQPFEPAL